MKKYLKVSEVAKLLSVNKMTIYRWSKAGKLKVVKIGRTIRVAEEELERFLNEGKEKKKK